MQIVTRSLFTLLILAATASADDLALVRDGRAEAEIVLAKDTTTAEERGARELRDHLREMSGAELAIVREAPEAGRAEVRIAHDAAMGPEEYRLKTDGRLLNISGGRPRGVLYGCYALLDRLGVRWYAKTAKLVPRLATVTLPALDERGVPAFDYRYPFTFEADDPDWAARNRVNGASKRLDASYGGSVLYNPFVHSLEQIVPAEMFEKHPEYFPLVEGKRSSGVVKGGKVYPGSVQRCLSNREVVKLAIAKVREWIRECPEAQICSVSQNDGDGWCGCAECRKLTERYGATSGVIVEFVNQVAEAIEKDHPGLLIDTLAYGDTLAPPKNIAPRRNVRVRLCPISVCHAHPLEFCASKESKAFLEHLKGWDALTDALSVWHYNAGFAHFLMPFPDFAGFSADLRLYRKSGVRGVFFQGAYTAGGGGSDAELRSWVMTRLLWNPDEDADALVTEWMRGVYGAAWEPMRAWFDRVHREAADPARHLYILDAPSNPIFSVDVLAVGDTFFDHAGTLAKGESAAAAVAKARLALRYLKLDRSKNPAAEIGRFLADARRFGIAQVGEGRPLEEWEAEMRARGK